MTPVVRVVFTGATSGEFLTAAASVFPHAEFRPRDGQLRGPAAYIAHASSHLDTYDTWFEGLRARVRGRLRACPLPPRGALYLPVTFDSWVVVADGPDGMAAAFEAARLLGSPAVSCPAFAAESVALTRVSGAGFTRHGDRVWPDPLKDRLGGPHGLCQDVGHVTDDVNVTG